MGQLDLDNLLREANETNNIGYTPFETPPFGHEDHKFPRTIEFGLGLSPWDNKQRTALPPA